MGTRNLVIVIDRNNKLKVAQYGQWDGYPSGVGVGVLKFCNNKTNLSKLEKRLSITKFIQDEDTPKKVENFVENYDIRTSHWDEQKGKMTKDLRTEQEIKWFNTFITRDLSEDVLNSIINVDLRELPSEFENNIYLSNKIDFLQDSLFCEWAYIIDLYKNKLQVLSGFNTNKELEHELCITDKEEVENRFKDRDKYYGCKIIKEYDLSNLPTKKEFLNDLEENGDEE